VADNPRGSAWTQPAQIWIAKLSKGATNAEINEAMKASYAQPLGGRSEWTIASSDVLQAVRVAAATEENSDDSDAQ